MLEVLNCNLNIKVLFNEVLEEMGESTFKQDMFALIFLEIAVVSWEIYCQFKREDIVRAVAVLSKGKQGTYLSPQLQIIIKTLLSIR